jgi:hypothetical protein
MTKSPHKLALRKETLRTLNTIDLARVVGGGDAAGTQAAGTLTHDNECPRQQDIIIPGK